MMRIFKLLMLLNNVCTKLKTNKFIIQLNNLHRNEPTEPLLSQKEYKTVSSLPVN